MDFLKQEASHPLPLGYVAEELGCDVVALDPGGRLGFLIVVVCLPRESGELDDDWGTEAGGGGVVDVGEEHFTHGQREVVAECRMPSMSDT